MIQKIYKSKLKESMKHILEKGFIERPISNIFLVTGKQSYEASGAKKVLDDVLKNYNVKHFNDFSSNPKLEYIEKGIGKYGNSNLTIAVGGGSAIDTAKAINVLSIQKGNSRDYVVNKKEIINFGKPLIAVPTTAGSGSEATKYAVIYVNGKKHALESELITPNYTVLDPKLTFSMPKKLAASSGMDALSQSIESYWSVNSNNESRQYSKKAVEMILKNIELSANHNSRISRRQMLYASNYAGKAINISKTTAPHATSYFLTSKYRIPHGCAVALTLGEFLKYNFKVDSNDCNDKRGILQVQSSIANICKMFNCKSVDETADEINRIMHRLGLETRLNQFGIERNSIKEIADNVNYERLSNNPRKVTKEDLVSILNNIY